MKEETKKKLCKISKIVGFAITFGFAVFGVLCAAMLIGNGSKKDDIKTLDTSLVQNEVRSERNIKPRKAPDIEGAFNYAVRGRTFEHCSFSITSGTLMYVRESVSGEILTLDEEDLPSGYYYFDFGRNDVGWIYHDIYVYNDILEVSGLGGEKEVYSGFATGSMSGISQYVYIDWNNIGFDYISFRWANVGIYLIDTLELPVSSSISFPESFSPLGLFGDSVTNNGGYVYLPNATGNELDIEITGLLFKYGGVVYDGIHIECVRALSMGYINDDGELVKQGGANDYMWALSWIKFYQRYKGQNPQDGIVVVMSELKSVTDNANDMPVAFTGRTQWVNRSDRTIQIIDDLGTITGRYDGRYSDMTDKKLLEWVSSSFSLGNSLGVMGNNSVFDIFTNAFDSVLPILSIAILPNITLGMLLFIPLIGAIIVIIIRVVKK